jgi:hypothetical protein
MTTHAKTLDKVVASKTVELSIVFDIDIYHIERIDNGDPRSRRFVGSGFTPTEGRRCVKEILKSEGWKAQ